MILKIDGKQKCQINATQFGAVQETFHIFQIIGTEYSHICAIRSPY